MQIADIQETIISQWQTVGQAIGSLLLMGLGGIAVFLFGKAREAMFISVQNQLKKNSRLRPGTAFGHQTINQELHDLRKAMAAFRVCVHQFHNGDSFMLSNHSWKVSCTHEIVEPGAGAIFRENQSLPISHISDWVGPIVDNTMSVKGVTSWGAAPSQSVILFDVSAMLVSTAKLLAESQGVGYALAVGLFDPSRKSIFGYISIHFQHASDDELKALKVRIPELLELAGRIQFYLTDDFRSFDNKHGVFARLMKFLIGT
jgi:hypothetical protein